MAGLAVTDEQWERIVEQLPRRQRRTAGGRPPADDCQCFEGILWILWQAPRGASGPRGMVRRAEHRPPQVKGMGPIGCAVRPMASLA